MPNTNNQQLISETDKRNNSRAIIESLYDTEADRTFSQLAAQPNQSPAQVQEQQPLQEDQRLLEEEQQQQLERVKNWQTVSEKYRVVWRGD